MRSAAESPLIWRLPLVTEIPKEAWCNNPKVHIGNFTSWKTLWTRSPQGYEDSIVGDLDCSKNSNATLQSDTLVGIRGVARFPNSLPLHDGVMFPKPENTGTAGAFLVVKN